MDDSHDLPLPALRRLARGLVYDRDRADDVIQEAWLAALRKHRPPAGLGAWLAGAVRLLASDVKRDEARRSDRERRAARREAQPSAADLSAQLEVLRKLLDAVDHLEEPYRTAIGLRYLDDLPPRAIAKRLGLPVNTVRTHVRRGLERLRRQLDGESGKGREELLAALAPLAGKAPWGAMMGVPGAPVAIGGGLGMLAGKKLAVSGFALVLAGLAWFAVRGSGRVEPEESEPDGPEPFALVVPAEAREPRATTPEHETRIELPLAGGPETAIQRSRILVRERSSQRPLAGARVKLERWDASPTELSTDEHGSLRIETARLREARLEVWADGHFPSVARVEEASADETTVVELADLPPGEMTLHVEAQGIGAVDGPFEVAGNETIERWIELGTGGRIHGRLLDAAGNGIGDANVTLYGAEVVGTNEPGRSRPRATARTRSPTFPPGSSSSSGCASSAA